MNIKQLTAGIISCCISFVAMTTCCYATQTTTSRKPIVTSVTTTARTTQQTAPTILTEEHTIAILPLEQETTNTSEYVETDIPLIITGQQYEITDDTLYSTSEETTNETTDETALAGVGDTQSNEDSGLINQIILLGVVLVLSGGAFAFVKLAPKFKKNTEIDEDEQAKITANQFINVKDIRGPFLHTNDGYIFMYLEVSGVCMELLSKREKEDFCHKCSRVFSTFHFPYKYIAVSSPYDIKGKLQSDSDWMHNSNPTVKKMLQKEVEHITRLVTDSSKIDRKFYIAIYSNKEDEGTIKKRAVDIMKKLHDEIGISSVVIEESDIVKLCNLINNPAYVHVENTSDIYLAMSTIMK